MRILVLRGGALGDFLVTLPALGLLRARWPAARIELAGNARAAALATGRHYLDAAHDQHEARWSRLYGRAPLPEDFATWLASFDLVFNCWPDPEGEIAARFTRPGQTFLHASAQPAQAPAAAHFCAPLAAFGLATEDFASRLHLTAADRAEAAAALPPDAAGPLVALHAGSGSPRKNWPLPRWIETGRALQKSRGARLLLAGGEADAALRAPLAAAFAGTPHQFAWDLPLPALAARLARARLFLGHDSGVSHLAAAAGAPCVLLFGPTDPATWAPPGPHVRVLARGADLSALAPADVLAAAEAALA